MQDKRKGLHLNWHHLRKDCWIEVEEVDWHCNLKEDKTLALAEMQKLQEVDLEEDCRLADCRVLELVELQMVSNWNCDRQECKVVVVEEMHLDSHSSKATIELLLMCCCCCFF